MNIRQYLKYLVAGALFALTAYVASAVTIDPNRNTVARANTTQQTSYYRVTVNFNDAGITTGVKFGRLIKNTFLSNVACHVTTAFNAGTTNVFTMGTGTPAVADQGDIIDPATSTKSINEASATYQQITQAGSLGVSVTSDADHDIWVRYTQTGTAATAGQAICVIEFVPDNDM